MIGRSSSFFMHGCNFYSCSSNWPHHDHKASQVKPCPQHSRLFPKRVTTFAYALCHFVVHSAQAQKPPSVEREMRPGVRWRVLRFHSILLYDIVAFTPAAPYRRALDQLDKNLITALLFRMLSGRLGYITSRSLQPSR